jgi:ankyrin repeat protein
MKYIFTLLMVALSSYSCAMEKSIVNADALTPLQKNIFDGALDTIKNNSYECTNYDGHDDTQSSPMDLCKKLKDVRKEIDKSICAASNRYELGALFNLLSCSDYKKIINTRYKINIKETAIRQMPHGCMIRLFGTMKKFESEHNFNQIVPAALVKDTHLKDTLRLLSLIMPNTVFGKKVPLLSYVVGVEHSFFRKIRTSLLLNPLCNVNAVNSIGDTALLIACKKYSFDDICVLLQHPECDPFYKNKSGLNVLDILNNTEQTAKIKALTALIQAKMDIYKKNIHSFHTFLQRKSPNPDYIDRLQKEIFDVTHYALQELSVAQKWDKVADWLYYGSEMCYANQLDAMYNTHFILAFSIADGVQKKLFVQKQLEIIQGYHKKQSKEDMLGFDVTQDNNVFNLVVLSLICPNLTVDSNGTPLLSYFILRSKECGAFWHEIPGLIYNNSCDVNKQDSDGWTPMHHAIKTDNVYAVRNLLDSDKCDLKGLTLYNYLMKMEGKNRDAIIRLLNTAPTIILNENEVTDLF